MGDLLLHGNRGDGKASDFRVWLRPAPLTVLARFDIHGISIRSCLENDTATWRWRRQRAMEVENEPDVTDGGFFFFTLPASD